jgi:hypothetical protein
MAIRYIVEIGNPVTHRFSTAVRSELEPSNQTYPDSIGDEIHYPVRLAIPKINSKISDSISGTSLLTQYTLQIENSDGKYDDVESLGWFNARLVLKRTNKTNPTLADFNTILVGELSYPVVAEKTVSLVVNNVFRALTQEACNTFNLTDYPNADDRVIDRDIPIGYGDLLNVDLFEVDTNQFIALDKDYITAVTTVYDRDGVSIFFSFSAITGEINAVDARTADVTGLTNNKIGEVITKEIEDKSLIPYNADNWDITETNEYIFNDSKINFYFDGGTVRKLVNAALKNDNAFLFTKNSGVLTIRQWGRIYKKHIINDWETMEFPKKDYKDAQRYFNSSISMEYQQDISNGNYQKILLTNKDAEFDKVTRSTFMVDLFESGDLQSLSNRLIERFSILSEIIPLSSGQDTSEMNLLDTIELDLNINGRQFSTKKEWIIREVDPGQDKLSLEARSGFEEPGVIDGVLSQPLSSGFGNLSQPLYNGFNGVLSQPLEVVE